MSRVADTVLQVAPEVEPPVGFESRLFERMGVTDASRPARRRLRALPPLRSIRPRQWVPAAVAAAAAFAALDVLPEEQRRAVVLAAVYGRTALEISEAEGIPLGTVKTRIRTALIRLRAAVEHAEGVSGER